MINRLVSVSPPQEGVRDERAPLAGEDQFRLLVNGIQDYAIVMLDREGRIASWNEGVRRLNGYEQAEIIGQPMACLYPPEAIALGTPTRLLAVAAERGRCEDEGWRVRKDGTRFFANVVITALRDEPGELIGYAKVTRDVTRRKEAQEALHSAAEQLKRAQHLAHMGSDIRILQTGERIWSDECYKIFGVSPDNFSPNNDSVLALVHPDDRGRIQAQRAEVAAGICPAPLEYRIVRPDGNVRTIYREWELLYDEGGAPFRLLGTLHDVTERRRTEEQLRQAQKMEAIGSLTGGLAHDFNNLLGVIIGNLDLASDFAKDDTGDLRECIGDALDAALRGADLTQRLLAFARRQPLRPALIDISALVTKTVGLLRRLLGEDIEIALELGEAVWEVAADPAQLEASLTNLATNARDAMPKGGRLIITTANGYLDADYAATHPDVTPGEFAMISITDSGTGISREIVHHIFEPFFTTKEQGKGTGLGLSMVFGFIKQSGGHVAVYSELGLGTTFRLFLPRALTVSSTSDVATPKLIIPSPGKGERILIVEDNEAMRRILKRQLQEMGYQVFESDRAAAALEVLQSEQIDLLLTDIVTPGKLDGVELVRIVRERWPALKTILTSGFPRARVNELAELASSIRLLAKPYRREDLAAMLRTVFDT